MAHDWHETSLSEAPAATRREVDARIQRIGRRQKQLIRLPQLAAAGLSPGGVRSRASRGQLHRLHPAVYALHPPPYSRQQGWLAAVLAGGPGSVLSDLCAACHLGIAENPPLAAHISNAGGRGRSLSGITVHRRAIARCDLLVVAGIPCTSATRTVVDCAASLSDDPLEDLLLAADAKRSLNRRRLEELVAERRGQPGIARLRRLITDDPVESRTINERRMLRICRRFAIATPIANHPVTAGGRNFIADLCWPELRLIVEADSWRWHGGRSATESDRDRDQLLALAGWRVVRFTRDQIKHRPDEVGRRLAALVRSVAAGLSPA